MQKIPVLLLGICVMLAACEGKSKKNMSGNGEVAVDDFIAFFSPQTLPLSITDSVLKVKSDDSARISLQIFHRFVQDTIFQNVYGKDTPRIYQAGRFGDKEKETYLLVKTSGKTNALYAVVFTPGKKFASQMLLMSDRKNSEPDLVVIDRSFNFTIIDQYKDAGGTSQEFSQVYAFIDSGAFQVIMEDGLKKGEVMPILNPVDSLPAQNKYSGDYGKDDRNFISIRDGKTPADFVFFMNMDKGARSVCQGEIKGEARFVTKDSAVYKSKSDPCTVGFKFGGKSVRLTEVTDCGNMRPPECSFNAYYTRVPEPGKKNQAAKK